MGRSSVHGRRCRRRTIAPDKPCTRTASTDARDSFLWTLTLKSGHFSVEERTRKPGSGQTHSSGPYLEKVSVHVASFCTGVCSHPCRCLVPENSPPNSPIPAIPAPIKPGARHHRPSGINASLNAYAMGEYGFRSVSHRTSTSSWLDRLGPENPGFVDQLRSTSADSLVF